MGTLGSASIKLNLDRSQFDSDLKKLQSTDAGQIAYRIKLDTKDFERQIKGLRIQSPILIPLEIDTKTFDQQIKKLSTSIDPIKIDLAPNVKDFQEKLRRLSKITPVTVDIKVDEAKVRQQFEQVGKYAAEGFTQGFSGVEGAGKSAIDSMVRSVNKQLGIQSPSKVFREIGKYAIAGLMQGLDSVDESKLKGVVNKIEGYFKKSNIQISVKVKGTGTAQISQPVQPRINDNTADLFKSFESNLSNSIEKGFRNASKKGLFATLVGGVGSIISGIAGTFGSLAMGLILSPFKAGIAVVTTVLSGVGEKLGHELSSGVTSGLKSAIGGALSNFVGSGEIVGNALGEQIAESTGAALKKAMPGVASLISDSIREVLGSEKVATASAVRRSQVESTAAENKQTATKQIQKEFSGAVAQGLPARAAKLKSEIEPVLPQLLKDDTAFRKEYAEERKRLEKAAQSIKVKLTPRKLIERRVKEYEAQIALYTKLQQSLEASGDTEKASQVKRLIATVKPPDQDEKNISQTELQFAEAQYTAKAQQKFVSDRLSSKFGARQSELNKRKAEVMPKSQELQAIQQQLGQIGQEMEAVGATPPKPKSALPQGYLRVLEETLKESGVEKLETSRIPELVSSESIHPLARAAYDPETNTIKVSPDAYERIQTGQQNRGDTGKLAHEIRHGVQTDFGRMSPEEKRTAIPLMSPTPEESKYLGEAIDISTNTQKPEARPFVRGLEADAYTFEWRNANKIHEKVQKEAATTEFSGSLGFAAVATDNKLKAKLKEASTSLGAIGAASHEYGIDIQEEMGAGIEEFTAIRAGINPLLEKAKNLEVLSTEQIRELQKDIESAIADAFAKIESISQDIQQSYSQKLSDKEVEREFERQFEQSLNPQAAVSPKEVSAVIADVPPPVVAPEVSSEVLQAQSALSKSRQEEAAKQEAIAKLYAKTGDKGAGSKDKLATGAKSAYRDIFSIQDTFKGIDIEPQVKAALKKIQELNSSLSPILLEIENAEKLSLEDISQITGQIEATITLISHKIQEIPHQLESQAINISNRGQQSIPEWDMDSSEYLSSFKVASASGVPSVASVTSRTQDVDAKSDTPDTFGDEIAQLKKQIAEEKAQSTGEGLAPPPRTELPTPSTIPGLKFDSPQDVRKFALSNLNAKGARDLARRLSIDTKYANKEYLIREITAAAGSANSRENIAGLISQLSPDKFLSKSSIKDATATPLPEAAKIINDLKKARKSLADALKLALNLDGKERQIALEKIESDARNQLAIAKQLGSEYQLTGAQGKSLGGTKTQLKNISGLANVALAETLNPTGMGSELGANLVGAIGSGISGSAKKPIKGIQQVMASIEGAAKNQAEIKSPSRVFQRIGKFITEGLALGISEGYQKVAKAITDAMDTAKNTAAKNPIPPAPWEVDPSLNFRNPKAKTTDRLEAKINAQRLEAESQLNQKISGLELLNELDPSVGADLAIEDSQKKKNKRDDFLKQLRENPLKLLQGRSKNATVGKARYLTENAEGLASLAIAKVGESPTAKQSKGLLNLQDAFGNLGEKAVKFGQTKSDKDFKLLNAAVRELEASLKALGIPFELINHEIDAYTAKLKKMQAEGKIGLDVDVSALAPEKFSFIDNILSKFSGLELKGLKAIGGLVKGFLAFGAITYVQNLFTDISVNAFKAFVELDRLKTALNFASGGSAGGAQNLAFVRKTVEDLKIPLQASVEGFTRLAGATRNSALEGKQTKDLFQGLSEASTVLSLSAEDTSGTLEALSKAMSQGRVGADLFDELGVRIPGVLGIAARAMGTTEEEFNRLKEAGRLTPDDFFPKFGRQLHNEFGEAAKGASDNAPSAVFGVQNSFLELQQSIGGAVSPAAIAGLNTLSAILEAIASHVKELGIVLLGVTTTLGVKMVIALQSVITNLIATRLATGTLSGGMQALGQTLNNSASVQWAVGISATLELVNLLNSAINTDLVQSFDKAVDAAKRAAEETKKAFEKPEPESSSGVNRFLDEYAIKPLNSQFGTKFKTFGQKEADERTLGETQGLDPVATSNFGKFGDSLIGFMNMDVGPIKGGILGNKIKTWGEYERDKTTNDIQEQGFVNTGSLAEARYQMAQLKTGKGEAGKLRSIDAQLKAAEEERATTKATLKRDFTDKGQAIPAQSKQQLEAQNLKINDLNDQRSAIAKPLTLELNRNNQKIASIKAQLEGLNDPDKIANLGGEAAADKQRQELTRQLQPLKQFKAEMEGVLAALRIDPILAFTSALRKLDLAFAESQEKSQLAFDASKSQISIQQVTGFKSNKLSSRTAAVNLALQEKEKAARDYQDQQAISKGMDVEVNRPEFQTTLQRLGVTPDASAAKIDDVLKNTTDESDKGILEKLKTSREQKNKLSTSRAAYSDSMQKVQSTVQDFHSFQIDEKASDSSAVIQKNENLQTASIKRSLEAKVIVEEVANEKIAKIQLKTTQDQRKNLDGQLSEIRADHEAGFMSADEFAKKERDLTTQQTALEKQEAENRLAVQSASLARRLKEIEFYNKKAEALTATRATDSTRKAKEKLLSSGLTPQAQDQFALAQTKIDAVSASDKVNQVKSRIAQNKELYKAGLKDARDFTLEQYALNQELASANLAVVDQKITAEEKYREVVEHNIQRIMQAEENRFRKQQSQLDESKSKLDLYNQSLEQTKRLEESRRNLSKALSDAAIAPLENQKTDADDAEALVEKLKDPKITPKAKAAIKAQLQKLGYGQQYGLTVTPATVTKGSSGDSPEDYELQIKEKKATIEQKIASLKEDSMKKEQEFQRKSLENDLKRQKIAAQIALYDAQGSQLAAQKSKLEADAALKIAIAKKDPLAIQTAQTGVELANKEIDLSNQRVVSAQANLDDQGEISANATQEQKVTQGTETQNFQAGEERRRRGTALDLVETGERAGKPMSLSEAEERTRSASEYALSQSPQGIGTNPMLKLDLKPGENLFEAYQRQREGMKLPTSGAQLPSSKVDMPPIDKTSWAVNSTSIQPRESGSGNQFVEALKMANQGIEQRLDALNSAIMTLANTPRSLTVQTPNPVDDAAKLMSDMSRGQLVGAGL